MLGKLLSWIQSFTFPATRETFIHWLRTIQRQKKSFFNEATLAMLEGVLQVGDMQARDIMIPRKQIIMLDSSEPLEKLLPIIINSGHSRFPVTSEDPDEIIGILITKDLISSLWQKPTHFKLQDILRPVSFIPESKRLESLLQEFRINHQHMAITVDEYGNVSGLLTIEDILEQIVGEIEDEHDIDDQDYIKKYSDTTFTVKAITPIDEFNDYFHTEFNTDLSDTIGGIVLKSFGHLPKRGENIIIQNFRFKVLHADNRRIRLLRVRRTISS